MTDEDVQTATTVIPWYRSKIIQRLALSIIVQLLAALHLSKLVTTSDLTLLVDDLLEAAGIGYAAWALHARATKPVPPVALSKKAADAANVTNAPLSQPPPENPK